MLASFRPLVGAYAVLPPFDFRIHCAVYRLRLTLCQLGLCSFNTRYTSVQRSLVFTHFTTDLLPLSLSLSKAFNPFRDL